jgi:hypothetical protein
MDRQRRTHYMASTLATFECSGISPVGTSKTLAYVNPYDSVKVIHHRIVDAYQIIHIYFIKYCDVRPESRNSRLNSETSFPRQRTETFPLWRHRQTIILVATNRRCATTEVFPWMNKLNPSRRCSQSAKDSLKEMADLAYGQSRVRYRQNAGV